MDINFGSEEANIGLTEANVGLTEANAGRFFGIKFPPRAIFGGKNEYIVTFLQLMAFV